MSVWLWTISILDIRSRRVPIGLLFWGAGLAMGNFVYQYHSGGMECLDVLKGSLPGMLLLVIALITKKTGYGDGIALLCSGAVLGGAEGLMMFGISLFLISFFSILLLILRKVGRNTKIPYLPFLAIAWTLVRQL